MKQGKLSAMIDSPLRQFGFEYPLGTRRFSFILDAVDEREAKAMAEGMAKATFIGQLSLVSSACGVQATVQDKTG
jgi:hypothetical protein